MTDEKILSTLEALFGDTPPGSPPEPPPGDPNAPPADPKAQPPEASGIGKTIATGAAVTGAVVDGGVIAKTIKDGVVADIYDELRKWIAKGDTLETFQKRVEEIAKNKGWLQDETELRRAWRAKLIYETHMREHYQAQRHRELTNPNVLELFPYWEYVHGELREPRVPRPLHLSWHGLIIPANNDWWKTHFGPNGWGCTCGVRPVSRRELKRMGKAAPDEAPNNGSRVVVDKYTGEKREVPNGIDPGFDMTPGEWIERSGINAPEKPEAP